MKYRSGDKITIEIAEFRRTDPDGEIVILAKGAVRPNFIPPAAIIHHEPTPRPIQVGGTP